MALRSARRPMGRTNQNQASARDSARKRAPSARRPAPTPKFNDTSMNDFRDTLDNMKETGSPSFSKSIGGRSGSQSARVEATRTKEDFFSAADGDPLETRKLQMQESAKEWLKDFITEHRDELWAFDSRFIRASERDILAMMLAECDSRDGGFPEVQHEAEMKASKFKSTSSRLITRALQSGWGTEGRVLPRVQSRQNPRLTKIFQPDPLDDGYNTARRKYEDRLNRCFVQEPPNKQFFRTKGDIPDYGNFSRLGAALVRHTGKTF
uniref:Uncharacterized protein n=1 Tax=Phaeomonas parva TaxID=124430 RepID=A0A7S1U823_9STRA|mmetsp:Transcript_34494/g.108608  ORF Transcript_34494/g.108608 Transcript_34494/m.108608 type:complete len:266 (+) Transcript_34494:215-1012(+)|eukprot:CAMPEP_0118860250 /NCGR_PEP_ID=MMETSP1163-20130328/6168_1 /TAXON_ID=124430 /ORGANISM="Phaeomonas parva, Strain CCMP2877" /LENGTH=265 /DNA_ID=CAMNT_0006793921 /DNA_START=190 /DNA_END=987 /DNA_ORIENTATION=+